MNKQQQKQQHPKAAAKRAAVVAAAAKFLNIYCTYFYALWLRGLGEEKSLFHVHITCVSNREKIETR
jgi:hypothetical protein